MSTQERTGGEAPPPRDAEHPVRDHGRDARPARAAPLHRARGGSAALAGRAGGLAGGSLLRAPQNGPPVHFGTSAGVANTYILLLFLEQKNMRREAMPLLEDSVALDPSNVAAQTELLVNLVNLGEREKALHTLDVVRSLKSHSTIEDFPEIEAAVLRMQQQ